MESVGDNKFLVIIPLIVAFGMFSVSVSVWLSGHSIRDSLVYCLLCRKCAAGKKRRRKASLISVSVIETLGKDFLCSGNGNKCRTDLKVTSTCQSKERICHELHGRPQILITDWSQGFENKICDEVDSPDRYTYILLHHAVIRKVHYLSTYAYILHVIIKVCSNLHKPS